MLVRRAIEPGYGKWVFPGRLRRPRRAGARRRRPRGARGSGPRRPARPPDQHLLVSGPRAGDHRLRGDDRRRRAGVRRRGPRGAVLRARRDSVGRAGVPQHARRAARVPGRSRALRSRTLMATFVVAHGAWSAGWAWKKMRPAAARARPRAVHADLHRARRARASRLAATSTSTRTSRTCCGAARDGGPARRHPGRPQLRRHGGDRRRRPRARERIARLVYLDAFVPRDGQSLLDLQPPEIAGSACASAATRRRRLARAAESRRRPTRRRTTWPGSTPRRMPQPREDRRAADPADRRGRTLPRSYIYCMRPRPGDVFRQFAERAQSRSGWQYLEIDASHNPHITAPDALAAMLDGIAASRGRL